MSNLKDLVPPLELCKLIPAGEFADSCFVRCFDDIGTVILCERENGVKTEGWHTIPAPTLHEIMAEIPFAQVSIFADGSFVIHPRFGEKRYVRCRDDNAATAALKLRLKLKGIEV